MIFRMSKHASVERYERIAFIIENIGLGEEYFRTKTEDNTAYNIITTTGVCLIADLVDETIITAYVPDIERITATYKRFCRENDLGEERTIPHEFYNKVIANIFIRAKWDKMCKNAGQHK